MCYLKLLKLENSKTFQTHHWGGQEDLKCLVVKSLSCIFSALTFVFSNNEFVVISIDICFQQSFMITSSQH